MTKNHNTTVDKEFHYMKQIHSLTKGMHVCVTRMLYAPDHTGGTLKYNSLPG